MKKLILTGLLTLGSIPAQANTEERTCFLTYSDQGEHSHLLFKIGKKPSNSGVSVIETLNSKLKAHAIYENSEEDSGLDFITAFLLPQAQAKVKNTSENKISVTFAPESQKAVSHFKVDGVSATLNCFKH